MNVFFFQAEDGIRDLVRSRGLGDVYKRQVQRIMVKDLGITDTSFGASKYKNGKTIEIDVLGVSNGTNNRVVIALSLIHI